MESRAGLRKIKDREESGTGHCNIYRPPRGTAGKFIKEISFIQRSGANRYGFKVHDAGLFLKSSSIRQHNTTRIKTINNSLE